MPTAKILELHIIKSHGGKNAEVETVIKPEQEIEWKEPTTVTPVLEETKEVSNGMVEIYSADGRELEVSVGNDIWRGTTITVPADMEEEVRRLLITGNFYIR